MVRVAVYGSLKYGMYNHPMMGECEFVRSVHVKGALYLVSTYPALVIDEEGRVEVEVYDIPYSAYEVITAMEESAGYLTGTIIADDLQAKIYYAGKDLAKYCKEKCQKINKY